MNINSRLTIAGTLAGTMALAGCSASVKGMPFGQSSVVTRNVETCTVTTQNSINLILLGGTVSTSDFDRECARNQFVKLLLSLDMSHDRVADADIKALAIAIKGYEDQDIAKMISEVASGEPPAFKAKLENNLQRYRDSLMAQGAAEERQRLAPTIGSLQNQVRQEQVKIAEASQLIVKVEKPDFCADTHYSHIISDLNMAFPHAIVSLQDATLGSMGLSFDENLDNIQQIKDDLCSGSFLYVSARQGTGVDALEARHERFYQDQSGFNSTEDTDRPVLDGAVVVAHVAQNFGISAEFQDVYNERVAQQQAEEERLRVLKAEQDRLAAEKEAAELSALEEAEHIKTQAMLLQDRAITHASPEAVVEEASADTETHKTGVERVDHFQDRSRYIQVAAVGPLNPSIVGLPTEAVTPVAAQPQIILDIEPSAKSQFNCEAVIAEHGIIRSYEGQGAYKQVKIEAGDINYFECSKPGNNETTKVFVAASYDSSTNAQASIEVFEPNAEVKDRRAGLMGWVSSMLPN